MCLISFYPHNPFTDLRSINIKKTAHPIDRGSNHNGVTNSILGQATIHPCGGLTSCCSFSFGTSGFLGPICSNFERRNVIVFSFKAIYILMYIMCLWSTRSNGAHHPWPYPCLWCKESFQQLLTTLELVKFWIKSKMGLTHFMFQVFEKNCVLKLRRNEQRGNRQTCNTITVK